MEISTATMMNVQQVSTRLPEFRQSWISQKKRALYNTVSSSANHLVWHRAFWLVVLPIYGISQIPFTPLRIETLIWSILYYAFTGTGITAGYHRLWAHASYSATTPLKIYLALAGAGAMQDSIRWWSRNHRAHHRYTDTPKDPYSVTKGLFYAHMGWLLDGKHSERVGRVDVHDLDEDKIVMWQHRHILLLQLVMGVVFPMSVAGLVWGDWKGGLIYASIIRLFLVNQATFCVNSLAHWLGESTFDDKNTPRDHYITAFFTFGEGYHNFHHTFPSDFRNALEWYQYDPTKLAIRLWKSMGLAYDLKTFRMSEIEKTRHQQAQKSLDGMQRSLDERARDFDWGVKLETLPVIEWEDYVCRCQEKGELLVAIAGVVHDVAAFADEHPGGKAFVKSSIGKDATSMFNGGVYNHSIVARNLLATLRVAVIRGGGEVEIWKSLNSE